MLPRGGSGGVAARRRQTQGTERLDRAVVTGYHGGMLLLAIPLLLLGCYRSGFYDFWHENGKLGEDCADRHVSTTEYLTVADKEHGARWLYERDQVLLGWVTFQGPRQTSSWLLSKATGVARRYDADYALIFEPKRIGTRAEEVIGETEVARIHSVSSDGVQTDSSITVPRSSIVEVDLYEFRMWFTRGRNPEGSCPRHAPPKEVELPEREDVE